MKKKFCCFAFFLSFFFFLPSCIYGEVQQNSLYERFLEKWELYFGEVPKISITIDKNEQTLEMQFRKLWEIYSQYIPQEERSSAEGAFRYTLLNDKRPLMNALNNCLVSSRLFPQKNGGILFYLFAEEEISDPSIVPQILPPGENGSRFMESLSLFGESESKIRTRMALFILNKFVENRMLRQMPNFLPVMLTLTQHLKDSEFVFVRVPVSKEFSSIKGEIKGGSKNIKVISLFVNRVGQLEKIGLADSDTSPLLIPSQDGTLFIVIFNASSDEQTDLLSATFWKDYNPPVSVVSAKLDGEFLKITLEESAGILGYKIEEFYNKGEKTSEISPFTKSSGSGTNDYFFYIGNSENVEKVFLINIYTLGGFSYKIPLYLEK